MKYSQVIGVAATIILALSGLMNWTWYPDIKQYFTGYYSYNNAYGRPGIVFIALGIIAIIFYLLPKIWAKRWNVFVCAIVLAYAVKTFISFSSCYRGICPIRQVGIWIMLSSAAIMLIMALLPDLKVSKPNGKV